MNWKYKSPDCKGGIAEDGTFMIDKKCSTCTELAKELKLDNVRYV